MTRLLPRATRSPQCSTRRKVPPRRGEVWLFDCGMVEKVRPVLVLSLPFADSDRAVVTVVFHTTTIRGSQFEVKKQVPFLKQGAFVAQSIATYPIVCAIRKLGRAQRNAQKSNPPCSSGLVDQGERKWETRAHLKHLTFRCC